MHARALATVVAASLLAPAAALAQEGPPPQLPAARRADPGPEVTRLELQSAVVADAARLIAEVAGWNVVCTPEAGAVPVSIFVQHLPVRTALETLCKVTGLWYREDDGILRIMTTDQYRDDIIVRREAKTNVFTLLHPNGPSIAQAIRDLYGDRVILSFGINDQFVLSALVNGASTGGTGTSYGGFGGNGAGLFNGSGSGAFSTGFGNGGGGVFGGGIGGIVGNGGGYNNNNGNYGGNGGGYGNNGQGIGAERAAEHLDARATSDQLSRLQVEGGKATGEDVDDLTLRPPPIYVSLNRRNNVLVIRTSDEQAMDELAALIVELDRTTPQVLLEVKLLQVNLNDDLDTGVEVSWLDGGVQTNLPDGQPANPLDPSRLLGLTNIAAAGSPPVAAGSLVYQYLNDHVRVKVQALASEGRLTTLATPLLLCANSEISRIFVGEEVPITVDVNVTTIAGTDGSAPITNVDPVTEIRDVGNSLRFVPLINADRTVSLTIIQDVSDIVPNGGKILVSNGLGGTRTELVDTVSTANVQGTVVAKDGLTLVVGGLFRKQYSDTRTGVPYLMDLPWIGWLFGSVSRREEHHELVLLITPHILTTPAEGAAKTRERLEALSLHPYVDLGDAAVNRYDRSEVPGGADYRLLIEDHILGAPEPLR